MKRIVMACCVLGYAGILAARTPLRAVTADEEVLRDFMSGFSSETLEFRAGDRLPVTFNVEGDLLTGAMTAEGLSVKRSFYVRKEGEEFLMSLHPTEGFAPLIEQLTGHLRAGVTGSPATSIFVALKAELKDR